MLKNQTLRNKSSTDTLRVLKQKADKHSIKHNEFT